MSTADELREFLDGADGYELWCPHHKRELTRIADRIDTAYQKAEEEWQAKDGQSWLHGYFECHAELMEGNEVIAADLERAGWIQLPKDADGETIRIGDSIETLMGEDGTCVAIELIEGGGWNVSLRPFGWDTPTLFAAESVRHVQPDSWERIIEDAAKNIYPNGAFNPCWDKVRDELVERCKRLAGEDE